MKLHLGCGRNILDGYVNIDSAPFQIDLRQFNVDLSTTQFLRKDAVDYLISIPPGSVDEIKSEHFLEHLTRTQMCKLLYYSYKALRNNGIFDVLVPTLSDCSWDYKTKDLDWKQTFVLDVIYGGNEPDTWGDLHKFGYDEELLKYILFLFGFSFSEVNTRDLGIQIIAEKKQMEQKTAQYKITGELSHLFSDVIFQGNNLEKEYYIYQIENIGMTSISNNANLYRQWFTMRESISNKSVAFYDSGYYVQPEKIKIKNNVDIIPFSCQNAISGKLSFDFSSLDIGFFNAGFVSGEIKFIRSD